MKKHPDQSFEINPKQKLEDIILKLVAEQNAEILEQLETIKTEFTGAFDSLAVVVTESVKTIKDDTNEKCKTLADTLIKLNSKISKFESRRKLGNDIQKTSAPRMKPKPTKPTEEEPSAPKAVPNVAKLGSR
jgi:hypothetical protein